MDKGELFDLIVRDFPVGLLIIDEDEKVLERARELGAVGFLGKKDHGRLVELINETVQQEEV